jgi:hypothetical protein
MGFATTDSYSTGPQLFMTATNTGQVNFPRQRPSYAGNTILDAANYNSYAPTLTGGSASGTWGISISGNAASVSINYSNRSNSTYQMLWGSGNSVYGTDLTTINPSAGYIYAVYYNTSGGGSERNSSGLSYVAGFNSSDTYIRSYNSTAVASMLGLGTAAYQAANQSLNTSSSPTFNQVNSNVGYSFVAQGYNNNGGFAMNNASTYWGLVWNYGSNDWRLGYGSTISQQGWNLKWDNGGNIYINGDTNLANVYASGWYRTNADTGLYFQSYGRGVWAPDSAGSNYGNVCTYGTGRNSWTGYSMADPSGYFYSLMSNGNSPGFYSQSQGYWVWYYGSSNYCLGIGSSSTTSGYALQVNGSAYITANMQIGQGVSNYSLTFYSSNYGAGYAGQIIGLNSDGNTHFYARNGSSSFTDIGYWSQNGFYITAYNSYSDIRLKNVIETNPTINVDGIDIIKYTLKTDSDTIRYGYSAQQVQEILPDIVKQDYNIDGTPGMLTLNYNDLHTLKIASLEKKVKELQTQLNQLLNK